MSPPLATSDIRRSYSMVRPLIIFAEHHLAVEFLNLFFQERENRAATVRQPIFPSCAETAFFIGLALEPAMFLQACEQRIQGSRADLITMLTQFLNHPLPHNRTDGGMVKDVDLPKSEKYLSLQCLCFSCIHNVSL